MKLYIQNRCTKKSFFPKKKDFLLWLYTILENQKKEITIRIVDCLEIKYLNYRYRNHNIVTNVLSFPSTESIYTKHHFPYYIGDIILCSEYINKEARHLKKNILEHWAHMVVHSVLHLLHYQHDDKSSQKKMQRLEKRIMLKLGYRDPYN
ncbi:rRNA maturation RNase YbeY [Buchnera aphidicola]|uniref:rRNA maturation RNase YbeY n=1 Tax=Buchnera aphidicola TaxID=9 RepID=UPI00094CA86D|nr:rRNA maturation RNase YbeY [Buchnera aphidicola]